MSGAGRQCERWPYCYSGLTVTLLPPSKGDKCAAVGKTCVFFSHERFFTQESSENPHVNVNDIEN